MQDYETNQLGIQGQIKKNCLDELTKEMFLIFFENLNLFSGKQKVQKELQMVSQWPEDKLTRNCLIVILLC